MPFTVLRAPSASPFSRRPPLSGSVAAVAAEQTWKQYERQIAREFREKMPGAIITFNAWLPGKRSGIDRQIDVLVVQELTTPGGTHQHVMVVDGKKWGKKLNINHIHAFEGFVHDVGADLGVLVTTKGYSQAAKTYAQNVGGIKLDVLAIEELAGWEPTPPRWVFCERCGFHYLDKLSDGGFPGYCPADGTPFSVLEVTAVDADSSVSQ